MSDTRPVAIRDPRADRPGTDEPVVLLPQGSSILLANLLDRLDETTFLGDVEGERSEVLGQYRPDGIARHLGSDAALPMRTEER